MAINTGKPLFRLSRIEQIEAIHDIVKLSFAGAKENAKAIESLLDSKVSDDDKSSVVKMVKTFNRKKVPLLEKNDKVNTNAAIDCLSEIYSNKRNVKRDNYTAKNDIGQARKKNYIDSSVNVFKVEAKALLEKEIELLKSGIDIPSLEIAKSDLEEMRKTIKGLNNENVIVKNQYANIDKELKSAKKELVSLRTQISNVQENLKGLGMSDKQTHSMLNQKNFNPEVKTDKGMEK